jgi:hypothetical protein
MTKDASATDKTDYTRCNLAKTADNALFHTL